MSAASTRLIPWKISKRHRKIFNQLSARARNCYQFLECDPVIGSWIDVALAEAIHNRLTKRDGMQRFLLRQPGIGKLVAQEILGFFATIGIIERAAAIGKKPSAASKRKAPPPFDPRLRYTVDDAAAFLRTSRMTIYNLLHAGDLQGIKEGSRTYITGQSIADRCAPPKPKRWVPNASRRSVVKGGK